MQLSDLSAFATAAEHGGITRAAERLNTVQSNVTARIKALELEIGTPLFERHSRGVTLTEAGRRMLPYAHRMAALADEAVRAARDDGTPAGLLRLGSMETTAAVRLPKVLAAFHARFPAVELEIVTGTTGFLLDEVLAFRLDAALVAGPVESGELESEIMFREELVLVSAPGWKAPSAGGAGPLTLVVFRQGCAYRQRLEQLVAARGWLPVRRLEFGTLDGILGCVAANVGVSLVPRAVAERAPAGGSIQIHELPSDQAWADTVLVRRRAAFAGSAMRRLVDDVRELAA